MTFEQFDHLAATFNIVPVSKVLLADMLTPVSAYLRIRQKDTDSYLFESVEGGTNLARYSFIGTDPVLKISCKKEKTTVSRGGVHEVQEINYFEALKNIVGQYCAPHIPSLPRFTTGLVGYIGYDLIRHIEAIPERGDDYIGTDDAIMELFTTIVVFDHLRHELHIIINVAIDESLSRAEQYAHAQKQIQGIEGRLRDGGPDTTFFHADMDRLTHETEKKTFLENVKKAKEYIRNGDIFQVVLSQRFSTGFDGDPFTVYRALRVINPSPYLYFLDLRTVKVIGSSPEILVRVEHGQCEVYPIAGTRARGTTENDDIEMEKELLGDEKERAEHIMLVDLGRNDLGRVCVPGSVNVKRQMFVVRYSHVMHIASQVTGTLQSGSDCIDVFTATFPAGTVSGAPKIRAMEIIDELEPTRRGIYAGGIGYLDFSGSMDMCIAIRTITTVGSRLYFQVGAGIVADSVPENEYQETLNKAQALIQALKMAEGIRS